LWNLTLIIDPGILVRYSMSDSDSDTVYDKNADEKLTSHHKKVKRLTSYHLGWESFHEWKKPVVSNKLKTKGVVCMRDISTAHGGMSDLKQHAHVMHTKLT
jgi:hypothetical protein